MIATSTMEKFRRMHPDQLRARLDKLDREWVLERATFVALGCLIALAGIGLRRRREIAEEKRAVQDLLATHPGR